MKRIAILIENMFDERELIYPYYRLLEEGYEVHLIGTEKETDYFSKTGLSEKKVPIHLKKYQLRIMME